jgi:murein DD-endopeptidase MepM/ murein hydrolase activator NlpD
MTTQRPAGVIGRRRRSFQRRSGGLPGVGTPRLGQRRAVLGGFVVVAVLVVALLAGVTGADASVAAGAPIGDGAYGDLPGAVGLTTIERFSWPLHGPHPVLRPFERPATRYGPGHRGVDLGGVVGQEVLAADAGVVLYAGPLADRSLVSVEHPGGLRTTYEPVDPTVVVGQSVQRGQVLGHLLAGHPGCPAAPPAACLHWGAHRQRDYLDPLRLVEFGRIRLLPWAAQPMTQPMTQPDDTPEVTIGY